MLTGTPKPRVLCVDDEPMVLEGLKLHLRTRFEVQTASGGEQALEALKYDGPFAVVISDMRMPGMNGAELLAQARELCPDTVRMLLTGYSDVDAAVAAVNQGQIFRFLSKPCPPPLMFQAVSAAVEQHRLVHAEKVLLEQTLAGSIKMLTELLSLANPLAFGRALRLKRLAGQLCDRMEVDPRWHIEAAAQLSQVGCITLSAELAEKVYYGRGLAPAEQELVDRLPDTAAQLLGSIPRLEPVREILTLMARRFDGADAPWAGPRGEQLPLGARMLRLLADYDRLEAAGEAPAQALAALSQRPGLYDPGLLEELRAVLGAQVDQAQELPLKALKPGMVFAADVRSRSGTLLMARGQTVTPGLLERMRNLAPGQLQEPFQVLLEAAEPPARR